MSEKALSRRWSELQIWPKYFTLMGIECTIVK